MAGGPVAVVRSPALPVKGAGLGARQLLTAFLDGRNERTMKAYGSDLEDFARFLGVSTADTAAESLLALPHGEANALALAYRADMQVRELAPNTINRRLAALRSLVLLAQTLGMVPWALIVSNVRAEKYRDTRGPGDTGVRRVFEALAARTDAKGRRDYAIARLLYTLGLRAGEVVNLDVEDVDLERFALMVHGKGRSAKRPFSLPRRTADALRSWLDARAQEFELPTGPLFTPLDRSSKEARRLTYKSVRVMLADLGERIGMHLRPHGLRHAAVTAALDSTKGDVRRVAQFSRHLDLRTVAEYDDNRTDTFGQVAALLDVI